MIQKVGIFECSKNHITTKVRQQSHKFDFYLMKIGCLIYLKITVWIIAR